MKRSMSLLSLDVSHRFRSRAFYCGIAGALNQLFAFVGAKTYYDFERLFSLAGVVCFYGVISVCGYVAIYISDVKLLVDTCFLSIQIRDYDIYAARNGRSIIGGH